MTLKLHDIRHHIGIEVKALIHRALKEDSLLQSIANESVVHDNGFEKIVLRKRNGDEIGYRIHAWQPGYSDSNIHTHRWDMASFILDGEYTAVEYNIVTSGSPYYMYRFKTTGAKDYSLKYESIMQLRKATLKTYARGDQYILPKGALHKIGKVSSKGALTIMLSWGEELDEAQVFTMTKLENVESNQRALIKEEVRMRMVQVLEQMQILKIN